MCVCVQLFIVLCTLTGILFFASIFAVRGWALPVSRACSSTVQAARGLHCSLLSGSGHAGMFTALLLAELLKGFSVLSNQVY